MISTLKKILVALLVIVTFSSTAVFQPQASASSVAGSLTEYSKKFLGTPYKWGGTTPSGFDCSGFLTYVFREYNITLPRTSADQFASGTAVSRSNLQQGDLVFFTTYKAGASHSGIYLGSNKFIHASDKGVIISDLDQTYYRDRYVGARRYISQPQVAATTSTAKIVDIVKPINLWKRNADNSLTLARILYPGETYRVYGYDGLYGGQFSVGGGYYITNMPAHISLR
ncbi:C40 family peptidase [Jeotgalibacillus sp. R-1-5s-1]|uniref:C40 family peptidase n=1 Tax=Jeotgalibacillus sp. R-1-5s-1 TaxID=2555897 RepID=UPI00106B14B1|nr:C40 family peptidase [Jeotgalibacillus sp. R-1-5s-1]TFD95747.1 NlpC/P60 family protein [Jeotgalibacillus sp. R-1-5s-1]